MSKRTSWVAKLVCSSAKVASLALVSVLLPAQSVHTDHERRADFGKYHTYCWNRVHASNQLVERRIQDAVRRNLNHVGWTEGQNCDISIAAVGMLQQQQEYTTFYNSLGSGWGWGGRWGWGGGFGGGSGPAITTVNQIPIGTLVIDLFDTQSKQLVWRGTSQQQLSSKPEKNIPKLNKAVDKMFKDFPPRSQG